MTKSEVIKELEFWRDEMLVYDKSKEAFNIAIECVKETMRLDFKPKQIDLFDMFNLEVNNDTKKD